MQICTCGNTSMEGAIFCEDCGKLLVEVAENHWGGTTTIVHKDLFEDSRVGRVSSDTFPKEATLVLSAGTEAIRIQVDSQFVLGRATADDTDRLVIDLSRLGATDLGVSRRHAGIYRTRSGILQVSDLGSANGTFINGLKLLPNHFYSLNDGDMLSLGRLEMQVSFDVPLPRIS